MRRALQIMRACSTACGAFFSSLSPGAPLPPAPAPSQPAALPQAPSDPNQGLTPAAAGAVRPRAPAHGSEARSMHARLRSYGQQPSADVGASLPPGMVPMQGSQ